MKNEIELQMVVFMDKIRIKLKTFLFATRVVGEEGVGEIGRSIGDSWGYKDRLNYAREEYIGYWI